MFDTSAVFCHKYARSLNAACFTSGVRGNQFPVGTGNGANAGASGRATFKAQPVS